MTQRMDTEPGIQLGPAQLANLVDLTSELVAILAADGALQFTNAAFRKVLGCPAEHLLGRSVLEVVHALDAYDIRERLRELVVQRAASVSARCRLRCLDGSWRWIQFSCHNRLAEAGVEGLVFLATDVTALHRMESERQVISNIVHALNETSNLDQLLSRIHESLQEILPAENCFVALHDPEHDTFQFPFFVDEYDSAPAPQKVGRSCTAYVFRTGQAKRIPQTEFDRLAALGEVELVGSPSPGWLGVPLKTPTATIGVLVVQHYQNEHAYDRRDLEFLESVGGHIALAIERRRSEEAMRKSETMFRQLFSRTPLPKWVSDLETGEFLLVNEAAMKLYGYAEEEFRKMTLLDLHPAAENPGND